MQWDPGGGTPCTGGESVGGERGGDVLRGEGIGFRACDVGPGGERAEVGRRSVIGVEGQEEGLVVGGWRRGEEDVVGGGEDGRDEERERLRLVLLSPSPATSTPSPQSTTGDGGPTW